MFGESTASSKNLETGIRVKFWVSLTMRHILNKQLYNYDIQYNITVLAN
jgi:hypothetical protein